MKYKVLKKGTIVWTGSRERDEHIKPYKYLGQRGQGQVLFAARRKNTAKGYSQCHWLREYALRQNLKLVDVSTDQMHYEGDEVWQDFCAKGQNGIYLKWHGPQKDVEYAFCYPKRMLILNRVYRCANSQFKRVPKKLALHKKKAK